MLLYKTQPLHFSIEVFITLKKNLSRPCSPPPHPLPSKCNDVSAEHCRSACLPEVLARLFLDAGYEEVVNEYVFRETVNKKEGLCVPRVFLQCKFRKSPKNPTPVTPGLGYES